MLLVWFTLAAAFGYLVGSIPTGFLWGRAVGLDIRKEGSGNIGATNVLRVLGRKAGFCVLAIDALKGGLAVGVSVGLASLIVERPSDAAHWEHARILAGLAAVLGHNYTCWLKFKGGKGISTSAGVLVALMPAALGIILATFIVVVWISRYVSLGSIAAAATLPFAAWGTGSSGSLIVLAAALGALAIAMHRSNIRRLLDGTEHRFERGGKKSEKKKAEVSK